PAPKAIERLTHALHAPSGSLSQANCARAFNKVRHGESPNAILTASLSLSAPTSAASCARSAAERPPAINGSRHPRPRARRLSGARALRIDHFCDATTGGCAGWIIGFATTSVLFASSAGTLAPGWKLHCPDLDDSA